MHIEIVHSLDTDSMINALRRFISSCGYPEQMRSEKGTNFTKADKEAKEGTEGWNQQMFTAEVSDTETMFLDTKVYRGERFAQQSRLDIKVPITLTQL